MRIREKKSTRSPLWLLVELLVVFAGVYGAFLFENYKNHKQNLDKAQAACEFFLTECLTEKSQIESEKKVFDSIINPFLTAYKNGEMPDIQVVPAFFTSSVNTHIWEAMLASGGTKILDFTTIQKINQNENNKLNLLKTLEKGGEYCMLVILPASDKGKGEFYDYWTRSLKPKYHWYILFLQSIRKQYEDLENSNLSLIEYLTNHLDEKNR